MISSTARDLPEHRKQVMAACLAQDMFPEMMEHLPATDADAVTESLHMVDEADVYLGVFAWRYGYVPRGYDISITEMEYNRAVERGIPRLLFLMHDEHPVKAADVEKGPGAAKLEALKQRMMVERVANFFKSPDDLRAQVINCLSKLNAQVPGGPNISDAHREYLKIWFGQKWTTISLADIVQESKGQVDLLDLYVPVLVDHIMALRLKNGLLQDWRVAQTYEADAAALAKTFFLRMQDMNVRFPHVCQNWAELNAGPDELEPVAVAIHKRFVANDQELLPDSHTNENEEEQILHTFRAEEAASVQRRFVLLGNPGTGKTSFLHHLTLCLAGEQLATAGDASGGPRARLSALDGWLGGAVTPIYIVLRDLVQKLPPLPEDPDKVPDPSEHPEQHFWRYVENHVLSSGLNQFIRDLRLLFGRGEAVLLLDGLDEISDATDSRRRTQIKDLLRALVSARPNARVIITSRPHAYRTDEWQIDGFGFAEIRLLEHEQMFALARTLFTAAGRSEPDNGAKEFVEALNSQKRLPQELYSTPLLFTLLAELWLDPRAGGGLPTSIAELYHRAVDLFIARWTRRRLSTATIAEMLGMKEPEQLRGVLEALAFRVHAANAAYEEGFEAGWLEDIVHKAGYKPRINDVPDYLEQHAGIVNSPRFRVLQFAHRSFQEYLAACELTCANPERRPPVPQERRFPEGLIACVLQDPDRWDNVIRLAAGELVRQRREHDLWRVLPRLWEPYLEQKGSARTALLALDIAGEQGLFDGSFTRYDARQPTLVMAREVALRALVDWQTFTPEQRDLAGRLLGRRPEHDTRAGVCLQADGLPDVAWVEIPEADAQGRREFVYQQDERRVEPTFWIARYPITYRQFQAFVDAPDGYADPRWWEGLAAPENVRHAPDAQRFEFWNHPRDSVTWYAAVAFCRWLTHRATATPALLPGAPASAAGWRITLPTEWQWEKAARGYDGRPYPWGAEYQAGFANVHEVVWNSENKIISYSHLNKTSAVGMYPQGATPEGVYDLAGNVWEWCLNRFHSPEAMEEVGTDFGRVLRGGSCFESKEQACTSSRMWDDPDLNVDSLGFRVVAVAATSIRS
jgi:formylglycine-generating enzyme required for sulfatase activity